MTAGRLKRAMGVLASAATTTLRFVAAVAGDVLLVCGAAAVTYGTWQWAAPAGYIVGGVFALVGGFVANRRGDD